MPVCIRAATPEEPVESIRWAVWDVERWRQHAACREVDPEVFFPVGVTGVAVTAIAAAKAICADCDAQSACLEFALTTNQEYGIWGGTSEEERRDLRRARRAARRLRRAS
jgi:WhiB family redox-sensing transcriptional regulator